MTTTSTCSKCGQPTWADERDWMNAHSATLVLLDRRGDLRAIEIDACARQLEDLRKEHGKLCGVAEAARTKARIAELVREIRAASPEIALRDVLIAEYLVAKPKMIAGTQRVLSAREAAGLCLRVGGAKDALDTCRRMVVEGWLRWATLALIRQALDQVPPEVGA